MATLQDFVKQRDFGGDSLPEGETVIDLSQTTVEEIQSEFDGRKVTRFVLKVGDKSFFVGQTVMRKIKKVAETGASKVRVMRQGTDKTTTYQVWPVKDV